MSTNEIIITRINKENEEELCVIAPLKQLDDSECIGKSITEEVAMDKLEGLYERGYDFWIARIGVTGEAVGYAIGKILEGEYYQSLGIFVLQDFRRKGIGTILRGAQTDYAKNWGCRKITSNVSGNNHPSIAFLQKTGFRFQQSGDGFSVEKEI